MRFAPLFATLLACCSGPASPTLFSNTPNCPSGTADGTIAPGQTVEAFAFDLTAGDRVTVEFESDSAGDLVVGLAGPYLVKDKATFAAQTVNEYPSDVIGSDGTTTVTPPKIDLPVHQDGRYAVVVSSSAEQGEVSWSACANITRAEEAPTE